MLSTLVLPTPDGPNSTVSPSPASKAAPTCTSPSRRVTSTSKDMGAPPAEPRQRLARDQRHRSEEHTSELQSLMSISYAVFCLTKKEKRQKCRMRDVDTKASRNTTKYV